ncbi:benenodin family lasso peptide [Sphingomonas sp. FW199]|nr:benenodin family lasso peptide [Sphingomonas sp. BGYR3]MDG5488848.1 benenodin family lasso peptide [Sphingomonas sp. BGYR3]
MTHAMIDLGAASIETLGGTGNLPDLIRFVEASGLSDD